MSDVSTWWYANTWDRSVVTKNVVRHTAQYVVHRTDSGMEYRHAKQSGNDAWFATKAETVAWLVGRLQREVDIAQSNLDRHQANLATVKERYGDA